MDALPQHSFPSIGLGILNLGITVCAPLLLQTCSSVFLLEENGQGLFETTTENHRRPNILFSPAIQIPVPITSSAAEILRNLRGKWGRY